MGTLFVSDLHLSAERPQTIAQFIALLQGPAREAEALYILGDLFEAWLGDDLVLPEYAPVLEALKALGATGVPIYVMHGNRDFLLGEGFERLSGCTLIDEGTAIDLDGRPTLLLHGDSLCTDDEPYQQLRRTLRDPQWVAGFLAKTPQERIAMARELREKSREEVGRKTEIIMDVNAGAVSAAVREHGVSRLIHGHTHRPAVHHIEIDGRPVERIVLGAWEEHGSVLECVAGDCRLQDYP